jgi:hypothetical protein
MIAHVIAEKLYDFSYRLGYLTKADAIIGHNIPSHEIKKQKVNTKFTPSSRDFY